VQDASRRLPVGSPVDQAAHGAPRAHRRGDQLLVETVLQGDDGPVQRQAGGQDLEGSGRVLRLDGEEHQLEAGAESPGRDGANGDGDGALARLDRETAGVHGLDVVLGLVHEEDVVAGLSEAGAGDAADGAGTVNDDGHAT
jgi:hypothetical protein